MPIFEYRCADCGARFEKLIRNAAQAEDLCCPECGRRQLLQEFSTFAAFANGAPKQSAAPPPCAGCPHPDACGRG
jgi:putative FmdB family regulatory protein